MVMVTSNSGVGVSKIFFRDNGKRFTCSEYFWLSSSRSEVESSEKVYFSTEKPAIYRKSLEDLPENFYYLDEVWLTT